MSELEQALARLRAAGFPVNGLDETDSRGIAFVLGWTPATLSNRRSAGLPLPAEHRFGRTYWARVVDVIEWRRLRDGR